VRSLAALLTLILLAACGPSEDASETAAAERATADLPEAATIRVRGFGEIRIRFFPAKAPGHVANFAKLARDGTYDGTTFHRIIPGFMIQGGDPLSKDDNPGNDGTGDAGYKIPAEFNDTTHRRGIVSMARGSQPDSAGTQFFIVVKDSPFLDGKYSAFGEVTSGMDVADAIVEQPRDPRDRPLENVVMESVTVH
jgi:peptidyl-prolyl cis-trans isomerase B (cyclophilin B)